MKDDLRARPVKRGAQRGEIAHIAVHRANLIENTEPAERLRPLRRRRVERIARHLRPRAQEEHRQPHALKARMPCEEYVFATVKY